MAQDAECYQKTVDDRAIILNVRSWYSHPFIAGDWTDLRLGAFCSVTDDLNDDLTTGLGEALGLPINQGVGPHERYWIGAASGQDPGVGGTVPRRPPRPGQPPPPPATNTNVFIGFTNAAYARFPQLRGGDTELKSSDAGVGAGGTFWRPRNTSNDNIGVQIFDGIFPRARILGNNQIHFPQDATTVAAGYAVLLAIQLLRDNADSRTITARIKSATNSADWLYSNTPTKELIQQTIINWPAGTAQMGPVELAVVPNSFFFYWPFHNSRLRIHSISLVRAA